MWLSCCGNSVISSLLSPRWTSSCSSASFASWFRSWGVPTWVEMTSRNTGTSQQLNMNEQEWTEKHKILPVNLLPLGFVLSSCFISLRQTLACSHTSHIMWEGQNISPPLSVCCLLSDEREEWCWSSVNRTAPHDVGLMKRRAGEWNLHVCGSFSHSSVSVWLFAQSEAAC